MISRYTLPEIKAVWSDENKFNTWLKVELLAAEAWVELGRIPREDFDSIANNAKFDIQRIDEIEAEIHHDVIAFLTAVTENIGPSGKYLHYGLTSSDMLDTALSVLLKQSAELLISELKSLIQIVKNKSVEYQDILMPGRTHGVHAEPMTLGLKFAVWYFELKRDLKRLQAAKETVSYGKLSGAVGTYATIDPKVEEFVCAKLGLTPAQASSQILQRDRHAEFMTTIAITGTSLERIATEIRALQKTETGELEEPFAKKQKGSSAMPHKKNPIICERICGLARLLRGNALVAMENMVLWHERDISHSSAERVIFPDSTAALFYMLRKTSEVLGNLTVRRDKMAQNLNIKGGVMFSQKVLLALIDAGMQREVAYRIVQSHAMRAHEGEALFNESVKSDEQIVELLGLDKITALFDAANVISTSKTVIERVEKDNLD